MPSSDLICVGLNHAQTPIELRERVAFPGSALKDALREALLEEVIEEAAILSTCNRIEIYAQGSSEHGPMALDSFLHRFHQIPNQLLTPHLYSLRGPEVLGQLMRVTSSLDSLVVGEPQILGQVKDAYVRAREHGAVGPILTRAFSRAFLTAKRVRTETDLGKNAVTVAYAAVQLAGKVFGELKGLQGLLIGAGEMGTLAASHFRQKGAKIELATRSSDLMIMLAKPDFVVAAASATQYLIDPAQLKAVMRFRRYKPLFLIDIAVPRNIDPKVAALDNVYLYNIDDLAQVVANNLEERRAEALKAEQIIAEELESYRLKTRERQLVPVISELQSQNLLAAETELSKLMLQGNFSGPQNQLIEDFAKTLSAKLFHQAVRALKHADRLTAG
ncbi:MAG: glutamyl-tRNA reductase [Myxococcota bacterium]